MTKRNDILATVSTAAANVSEGQGALVTAAKAAVGNRKHGSASYTNAYKETQRAAIVGYVAGALGFGSGANAFKSAEAVLAKAGATGKGKLPKGKSRRNAAEERAYTAARTMWSRVTAAAGLKSPDARGGANSGNTAKRKPKAGQGKAAPKGMTVEAIKKATANQTPPKASNREEAFAFIEGQAAMLLQFCNKRAAVVPAELGQIVNAFKLEVTKTVNALQ